jgi:CheY-like chemotaxis protein
METLDAFALAYPLEILVADQDNTDRIAVIELLSELGYSPDEAVNDKDLLQKAGKKNYDVILLNVGIPNAEGVFQIPGSGPAERPIFIGVSAAAKFSFKATALKARMDSCINSPVDRQELLLQLKACSVLVGKCAIKRL